MKKLITTCVLLAAVSMVSFAQSKQAATKSTAKSTNKTVAANTATAEQTAKRRAEAFKQQYGLNTEQYNGVYQAQLDYQKQLDQIKATGAEPGEGQLMQAGMMRDQKMKNAMSSEQYAKYQTSQNSQSKTN